MAQPRIDQKIYGVEEATAQALLDLLSEKKEKILSDLDDEEIMYLSALYTLSGELKMKTLEDFCDNFCLLRVSRFRLGRREMVFVAGAGAQPERKKFRSIRDLFTGLRA